ncbi:MAG: DUF4258 domain-containing protein [Nitriliruptorales bacterium]|nr:DUF4258 domain-containing protein [Nitriliruptorales bacterium]
MAQFVVGDRFQSRDRRLDSPALADKMLRRGVSRAEIQAVLENNEVIEVYEHQDRIRYVLLGQVEGRPLHVVVAEDDVVDATVVLSVYEPDEDHGWDAASGFRKRKEQSDGA